MEPQQGWLSLLETLIPSRTVTVFDVQGNEYTASTVLPARKQQAVIRKLMEILALPALSLDSFGPELQQASPGEQIRVLLGFIKDLLQEESVMVLVSEAIALAYPALLKEVLSKNPESKDAGDVFETDQLLGLLIPFGIRLASGLWMQAKTLSPSLLETSSESLVS